MEQCERSWAAREEPLLLLLAASSFVESGARLYAGNLVVRYKEDPEVRAWLAARWEPEELRHGSALRGYVEQIWPAFDWKQAFERFMSAYAGLCAIDLLEDSPALEMAARCVVETGTASLYRALGQYARTPVLQEIVSGIASDEIGHYKHFYRYFRKYQSVERRSRREILGALVRRSALIGAEDADIGLRYAFEERYGKGRQPDFGALRRRVNALVRTNAPATMAVKMWLKPLGLPAAAGQLAEFVAPPVLRCLIF